MNRDRIANWLGCKHGGDNEADVHPVTDGTFHCLTCDSTVLHDCGHPWTVGHDDHPCPGDIVPSDFLDDSTG